MPTEPVELLQHLQRKHPEQPVALFELDEDGSTLWINSNEHSAPQSHHLPLSLGRLQLEILRHAPPSPLALEQAIEVVEDVIMPLRRMLGDHTVLYVRNPDLVRISQAAQQHDVPQLEIDALERVFNRLSDVTNGLPAAQAGIPADTRFASSLLVLRECLHHWGVRSLHRLD